MKLYVQDDLGVLHLVTDALHEYDLDQSLACADLCYDIQEQMKQARYAVDGPPDTPAQKIWQPDPHDSLPPCGMVGLGINFHTDGQGNSIPSQQEREAQGCTCGEFGGSAKDCPVHGYEGSDPDVRERAR